MPALRLIAIALVAAIVAPAQTQTPPPAMPYEAVHTPEFVTASEATFLQDTRSTWNAYGLAVDGPMKGTQLKQVILIPQFWFAWSQFRPATRVFIATRAKTTAPAVAPNPAAFYRLVLPAGNAAAVSGHRETIMMAGARRQLESPSPVRVDADRFGHLHVRAVPAGRLWWLRRAARRAG
jgi:hypothetical protein